MKKVLIVASVASMIDQFNMDNIRLLKKMGYKIHIACNFIEGSTFSGARNEAFKKELKDLDVSFYQVDFSRNPFDITEHIASYKQINSLIETNRYEIIHLHSPIGGVIGRLVAIKARKNGTKVVYTAHGFHFFKGAPIKNWLIYYPIEKWLSRYTDTLITINKEDYDNAVNKDFAASEIKLIDGIGIDLAKFQPKTKLEKSILREEKGYRDNMFILTYVGELSYRKNQEFLIRVIAELKDEIPGIKLLLVGTGNLKAEYKDLINRLKISDHVEMLGYRTDVSELMGMSDVAVSASKQEGLPVNIMEAMASGLPLIVTNSRGNRDLVSHNENGYIVELDNREVFANYIEKLYKDKLLRSSFGESSVKLIKKYSLENILKEMQKIYSEI